MIKSALRNHPAAHHNLHTFWAAVMAETCFKMGLEHVVISPGSSSGALALGFGTHPKLKVHVILDERTAGFFALGLAKSSERPVVLIATSGTATANYFPALIEARHSAIPLLVLTADRPPVDRHCQSEQTIDQAHLYSHIPVWQRELPLPVADLKHFCALRDNMIQAYERCLFPEPGPVHINVPFPYPPLEAEKHPFEDPLPEDFFTSISTHTAPEVTLSANKLAAIWKTLCSTQRGIILIGYPTDLDRGNYLEAIMKIAKTLGWPVLADAIAPWVRGSQSALPTLITSYGLIIDNPELATQLKPDIILQIGRLPTNKGLRYWLSQTQAASYVLGPLPVNADPLFRAAQHLRSSLKAFAQSAPERSPASSDYAYAWMKPAEKIQEGIEDAMQANDTLFESKVTWALGRSLPEMTPWFTSTSMPIREAETFLMPNDKAFDIYANRGANGLDGLISTAMGVAEHLQRPCVQVIGDLGLLHDHAALLLARNGFSGSLTIVCVDNGGGSIFRYVASIPQSPATHFEKLWLTPQVANIPALAAAHGIVVHRPKSVTHLQELLENLPHQGVQLIYVQCDGVSDFAKRAALIQNLKKLL